MPNLIHSLDATSLILLYKQFSTLYKEPQFYSIHDCFGTTCGKVYSIKYLLASVYTNLYSDNNYLIKFNQDVLNYISSNTHHVVDKDNLILYLNDEQLPLPSTQFVLENSVSFSIYSINLFTKKNNNIYILLFK